MKNNKVINLKKKARKVEKTSGKDVLKELEKVEKDISRVLKKEK